jgi:hypothetical protein
MDDVLEIALATKPTMEPPKPRKQTKEEPPEEE